MTIELMVGRVVTIQKISRCSGFIAFAVPPDTLARFAG
jgi:hypothetical protein